MGAGCCYRLAPRPGRSRLRAFYPSALALEVLEDELALHFTRALADLVHLDIAPVP